MKQISKKLSLKKKTVAVLNDQDLKNVVGGKTVVTCGGITGCCPNTYYVCTY